MSVLASGVWILLTHLLDLFDLFCLFVYFVISGVQIFAVNHLNNRTKSR